LQTFKDLPKDYDAWNIDPGTLDHFTSIDKADSVELVEKGPLRSAIRVTRILAELEVCAGHHA
jgi:alpha-mannosidase